MLVIAVHPDARFRIVVDQRPHALTHDTGDIEQLAQRKRKVCLSVEEGVRPRQLRSVGLERDEQEGQ